MTLKNVRLLYVTPEFIGLLLKRDLEHHFRVKANGLPFDAKVAGCGYDHVKHKFWLRIISNEFSEVGENEQVPVLPDIEIETLN